MSRGWLLLPHLGEWMHDGQPDSQGHCSMTSRVARHKIFYHLVAVFGDADPSGVAVVDEDLGLACVRVQRCRYAADVVTVAHGEQRQDANGGVLDGVESAGQVKLLELE